MVIEVFFRLDLNKTNYFSLEDKKAIMRVRRDDMKYWVEKRRPWGGKRTEIDNDEVYPKMSNKNDIFAKKIDECKTDFSKKKFQIKEILKIINSVFKDDQSDDEKNE